MRPRPLVRASHVGHASRVAHSRHGSHSLLASRALPATARQATVPTVVLVAGVLGIVTLLLVQPLIATAAEDPRVPQQASSPGDPVSLVVLTPDAVAVGAPAAGAADVHPAAATTDVGLTLDAAADTHGVDRGLLRAVAWTESSVRPDARSHAGAVGVMQLMPATVVHAGQLLGRPLDALDMVDNVEGGAAYLAYLLDRADGDARLALAAYHQGWTGVARDGVSATSAGYVDRVVTLQGQLADH